VIQLGNASWQVLQIGTGVVRVADAKGAPPTLPFWLGEAPARSDELSRAVSDLRKEVAGAEWLVDETGIGADAAAQAVAYLEESRNALGVLPTQETLVLERFFDESGGMQLVLHAPFGSRVNKAWGLALRKRFCRQFNFELQAAATEDGLLLSLGPQHSFPLSDVFRYLHSATAKDILVQAFLDAPVFQTRWRWNTTIALAVPRNRHGKKVAPPLQRMMADDLMAAVFPDAAACLENIPGDRQIPDHPLVTQVVQDCLQEAMDFESLAKILDRIHGGDVQCIACDTTEPSPLCHELLNARPYAFLDDAPLEERRAHAVYARRAGEPGNAGDLGTLDATAIERVRDEERPDPRDADELHDVLLTAGFLTESEAAHIGPSLFRELTDGRRATRAAVRNGHLWLAAERLPQLHALALGAQIEGDVVAPSSRAAKEWSRDDALVELLRGRLAILGPATASVLAASVGIAEADVDVALQTLESQGVVLRGRFTPLAPTLEWCDRRLLARIHRYTLNRLRAEIEPVSPADFMRFQFHWQHASPGSRLSGVDGLLELVRTLDGFEVAAGAWESSVIPARLDNYEPSLLDRLCLTGQVGWARLSRPESQSRLVRATPIALFLRQHAEAWHELAAAGRNEDAAAPLVSAEARAVLEVLRTRGASFVHELAAVCRVPLSDVRVALGELVSSGLAASDGFAGLRGLIVEREKSAREGQMAGRWAALAAGGDGTVDASIEVQTHALLRRYGVVCRRLLTREPNAPSWRALSRV
ncbi:MAG: ATP-dependent DNA helicase, partial [Planctomycetota bacterium]|nr:ATP-dependent DNA helicase [Planctomycetota bacterium]